MIAITEFHYTPSIDERERASNSYLMSVVVIIAGLPLPIVNLIASGIYYLGNLKSTAFVRWHCIQAMFAQLFLFCVNSVALIWFLMIWFGDKELSNYFFAYLAVMLGINLSELIATVISAMQIQKGRHPVWWLFGDITNLVMRETDHD
jgi:hypothetical protein